MEKQGINDNSKLNPNNYASYFNNIGMGHVQNASMHANQVVGVSDAQ